MADSDLESRLDRAYFAALSALPHFAILSNTRGLINRPTDLMNELEGYEQAGKDGQRVHVPGLVTLREARGHPIYARLMMICAATVLPHRFVQRNQDAVKLMNAYYLEEPAPVQEVQHGGAAMRSFLLPDMLDLKEIIDANGHVPRIDISKIQVPWQLGVFYDAIVAYYRAHFVSEDTSYQVSLYRFVTHVLRSTPMRATPYFSPVVLRDFVLRYFDMAVDGVVPELLPRDDLRDLARGLYASGALAQAFAKRNGPKTEKSFCDTVAQCRMIDPAEPGIIPDGAPKVMPFRAPRLHNEVPGPGGKYRVPPGVKPYTDHGEK